MLRTRLRNIFGRRGLVIAVALVATAIALVARSAGLLDALELSSVDLRFQVRGHDRPDPRIVIVAYDNETVNRLNLSLTDIPRTLPARLITRIHADHPLVLAVDAQFIGHKTAAEDDALTRAISAARPVLLADHTTPAGEPLPVPAGEREPQRLGAVLGDVGVPTDSDGAVRRMEYAPVSLVNFDVKAAELATGYTVSPSHFPDNSAWIDFTGPPGTFDAIPIWKVLAGRVPASMFRDRIVLIGYTDPDFEDVATTPFSDTPMTGVEVHANAIQTILHGFPLRRTAWWLDVLLVLLAVMVPAVLTLRFSPLYVLGGTLAALAALLAGEQLAFDGGWIAQVSYPALGLLLSAGSTTAVDAVMSRRELRSLSAAVERLARSVGPGDRIGEYDVAELAGRGGMGVVYRATQRSLNRPVALKVIVPELAGNEDFRRRFEREALMAASIEHPNVVPVYEAGQDGGRLFLAMRFVEGEDLQAVVRNEGPLTPARAGHVIAQVAAALGAAHARGLVHRDVKPTNVLIEPGDHAYLTDFGLARQAKSDSAMTETGVIVGTVDYVAPEQISGGEIGPAVDIYALGCVLYETLTGVVPYPRDTDLAKLFAHVNANPPSAQALRPELTDAVDAVIRRAMAKRPEDRFAAAPEFAHAAVAALATLQAAPSARAGEPHRNAETCTSAPVESQPPETAVSSPPSQQPPETVVPPPPGTDGPGAGH